MRQREPDLQELSSFNLAHPPTPSAVIFAETAADVQRAVRKAVEEGRGIAVQSTGHGTIGSNDGAVLVATQRMTGIRVYPDRRTAWIGAGVRWSEVVAETTKHGLAPVNGSSPTVGVMGYALSGGIGLLSRMFGFAADTILAVQLVTADGELLEVTPEENSDLFWGVRGGRGSFGVATAIEVQLFPLESYFGGGLYFHPDAAADVLPRYLEWVRTLPEWFGTSLAMRGPVPPVDNEGFAQFVHLRVTAAGDSNEAAALLHPMRSLPGIVLDSVDEKAYSRIREVHNDGGVPKPFTERSRLLPRLTEELLNDMWHQYPDDDGYAPTLEFRHLGGAMSRMPAHPNAVAGRGSEFSFLVIGRTDDASRARAARAFQLADAASAGQPVPNFQGDEVGKDRVLASYDPQTAARLLELKATHDPQNVFRFGHVIAP
ncbi:FAD-binding oxidoreductase [Cryobacterium sp. BB307]|uniref:FAD-binding oxidoreductase n=1 Tax=Cryobacterium sp. BB307 TaxID=2716317 RepID=UPI00144867D3|nr:FAD-binding oxidoreductase [Cryobacterium sp. BB307]